MKRILTICLLTFLLLCAAGPALAGAAEHRPLTEADGYAVQLISGLRSAYAGIERERRTGDAQALGIQFDLAIQQLVSLSELFGFQWADQRLRELYQEPDCPDLHMAYSADRRIMLRVEPMDLKNPAFDEYRFYLCTLESLQDTDIHTQRLAPMHIELHTGSEISAELIEPGHPLWEKLREQADSYVAPSFLPSGFNLIFKQVYGVKSLSREAISAVSLDWDDHEFRLVWFENEVTLD
jgi:hypothetical protein